MHIGKRRHFWELVDLHTWYVFMLILLIAISPFYLVFCIITALNQIIKQWINEYKFLEETYVREHNIT